MERSPTEHVPGRRERGDLMKLGIMQPYFFPYAGYFDLINSVDRWVVFDTAQYIRHGWVNRNRILHPTRGWQYVIAPVVKHARETAIRDVRVVEGDEWRDRILRQLEHYRDRAPHFESTSALVREALKVPDRSLSDVNVEILGRVCAFLDIPFSSQRFSELGIQVGSIEEPGDWALRISEALGAKEYINPPGGKDIFDPRKFAALGIRLTFQEPMNLSYECPGYQFEAGLSIVDVLMWNSREKLVGLFAERRRMARG